MDHIFPVKHGGPTTLENLAYTYVICNRHKGSNIATSEYLSETLVPLFNPRKDLWTDHFKIHDGSIAGKTEVGKGKVKVLELNDIDRISERRIQIQSGSYPGPI